MNTLQKFGVKSSARLYFSQQRLQKQVSMWRTHLPFVTPHYAVKANNNPVLLRWLHNEGIAFDCASPKEMQQVLHAGATPSDIVYSNPCKKTSYLYVAQRLGIPTTVVDSPQEVEKLVEVKWKGGILVRLMVPDTGSAQPFSSKFGAPLSWVSDIMYAMQKGGLSHTGWSFHVGSLCGSPKQYSRAIEICAEAQALSTKKAEIIDCGGGFVSEEEMFSESAKEIVSARRLFPTETKWIAEPGRFMASPVIHAWVQVIGAKMRVDGCGWRYTLDESIYSSFSNIPFDGQKPIFRIMNTDALARRTVRGSLFGRTCDSADCILKDVDMPELRVGDWLCVENMGAYTTVSSTEFNGFPSPRKIYQKTRGL